MRRTGPCAFRWTTTLRRPACVEAGVEVVSFAPLSGTLEETYLALEGERR